jgi:hypothetical protein
MDKFNQKKNMFMEKNKTTIIPTLCTYCNQDLIANSAKPGYGYLASITKWNFYTYAADVPSKDDPSKIPLEGKEDIIAEAGQIILNLTPPKSQDINDFLIQSCGHKIHEACLKDHAFKSASKDVEFICGEQISCPFCKAPVNYLIPITEDPPKPLPASTISYNGGKIPSKLPYHKLLTLSEITAAFASIIQKFGSFTQNTDKKPSYSQHQRIAFEEILQIIPKKNPTSIKMGEITFNPEKDSDVSLDSMLNIITQKIELLRISPAESNKTSYTALRAFLHFYKKSIAFYPKSFKNFTGKSSYKQIFDAIMSLLQQKNLEHQAFDAIFKKTYSAFLLPFILDHDSTLTPELHINFTLFLIILRLLTYHNNEEEFEQKISNSEPENIQKLLEEQLSLPVHRIFLLNLFATYTLTLSNDIEENTKPLFYETYAINSLSSLDQLFSEIFPSNSNLTLSQTLFEFFKLNESSFKDILLAFKSHPKKLNALGTKPIRNPIPELDNKLIDFKSRFQKRKCDLCNKYPNEIGLILCLICGQVCCFSLCASAESPITNIELHALGHHLGVSVYLLVNTFHVIPAKFPARALWTCLYQDKYGQELDRYNTNWDNFNLNKEEFEKVKNAILTNGISQEIDNLATKKKLEP